jgi:hypothetical protein
MTELPRNISYHDVENAHVNHILEAAGLFVCQCREHTLLEILESITEDMAKLQHAHRLLIAYARTATNPPRYRAKDVAAVTGMAPHSVRNTFSSREVLELHNILYPSTPDYYSDIPEEEVPW